ncbi:MAG: MtnX-like HAD-IB family phosphatase [Ignavibacteriales bacterium]|nr:MtnX-like HAD-IB family phosphatase [Ignavibacteriales bacterium]
MNEKNFKIFVDFDGTITKIDVGEAFVNSFGNSERNSEIIQLWIENKITSPESWFLMFEHVRFDENAFDKFLDKIEIDKSFSGFVAYCHLNSFEVRVLSDGFDLYIDKILKRETLSDLEVFCNKAKINAEEQIIPTFPYGDEECKHCGNCKRNHILSNCGDEDYIIYIGDGYSDKCPIEFCDYVFAKDSLLKFCEINRITYFPFQNFDDVIKKLEELKSKKRLKKKFQAEVKRKNVFMQG